MDKKYIWFLGGLALAFVLIYAVETGILKNKPAENRPDSTQTKMRVVGTFYPLAHFAEQVGGDYVSVANITPAGSEPHDYEPTSQDIIKAYDAKVFIMNGGGVDTWAERIEPDLEKKSVQIVDMQKNIQLMAAPAGSETVLDPHIWLDPVLAEQEVRLIHDAFVKADPSHAGEYDKNTDAYIAQLENLDDEYKTGTASCRTRNIVTSHAAFGYMAKRYDLVQIPIAGLSPDAEPSAQQLADIAQLAKRDNIQYIFFETLVSPKLSQTIATEVGAKILSFNPLEGLTDEEIGSGKNYLTEMRDDLAKLRIALQCE
jgi:zinc transport system substrate-binding protein